MTTDATADRSTKRAERQMFGASGRALLVRTAAVALIDAAGIYLVAQFAANGSWAVMALTITSLLLVNWAYLSPRTQASRWLTPGLVLMLCFVAYPVLYTTYVSFTNYQTGNLLSREQAIDRLLDVPVRSGESGELLSMAVYRNASDDLALLVGGGETDPYFAELRTSPDDTELRPAADVDLTSIDLEAPPEVLGDFELLPPLAVTGEASRLDGASINLPGGSAQVETLSSARISVGGLRFSYDADNDVLTDAQLGLTCPAGEGTFFCQDVPEDDVQAVARLASDTTIVCEGGVCQQVPLFAIDQSLAGWQEVVGFDNYAEVVGNERIREPFFRVLAWNVGFAFGSVLLNFAFGLGLALTLKDDAMRFRPVYRSIYIVPYAIPGFLSILVWRGLLDPDFGQVNGLLEFFGLGPVNWLSDTSNAMISIFLVNLWLGFPYMFLICSGALTSIPEDLLEAARVDGAGPWRSFRTITLPLLLVSTAPLLIGAFSFNFNNFLLIFLLTGGGPPMTGFDVPVGSTDLLISFTFNLAAGAGRGNQFALATAIIVIIFLFLATTSALSFRLTKKLEEIYDQS